MNKEIYVVTAYHHGERRKLSYVVGVFSNLDDAKEVAEAEPQYRGGGLQYECEVVCTTVDEYYQQVDGDEPSAVVPLREETKPHQHEAICDRQIAWERERAGAEVLELCREAIQLRATLNYSEAADIEAKIKATIEKMDEGVSRWKQRRANPPEEKVIPIKAPEGGE